MSMVSSLLRVSLVELNSFLKDASKLEEKIFDEKREDDDPTELFIDKAWDGINFLLTGEDLNSDHDLVEVIMPDEAIDEDQDLGYGPATYLLPDRVKELHLALKNISATDLEYCYDAKKMTELQIYPGNWDQKEEMLEYLIEHYKEVQSFYAAAANNNEAIIVWLS